MSGRGRGKGKSVSFNVEALGFGKGEALPTATLQPPPLFPPQEFKPVPLLHGDDWEYTLALKQEFRATIRKSPYFIHGNEKKKDIERYSDKYQIGNHDANTEWTPDWERFPEELRIKEKKVKKIKSVIKPIIPARKKKPPQDVDFEKTLEILEKKEEDTKVEEDVKEKEGEEEEDEEDDDEKKEGEEEEIFEEDELEEETDYIMSYFDNGEGYGDDDDDADEGPIY
ncbi:hypothetical protein ACJMK2_044373 [Sinanodonta woodiana]|uniref:DNA-directed RNA polymerase III subunit n=1 Tax=Sinanodonta woodiana TaxID=1069815 RepID=A0ABD3W0T5_SINWO